MDLHGLEWMLSGVLALVFLIVGGVKVFRYELAKERFSWVEHVPRALAQLIGVFEILGALGLILPVATGLYPWLTPLAAIALGWLMFMGATFNFQRRESTDGFLNLVLLAMLAFVAYIRWPLLQGHFGF